MLAHGQRVPAEKFAAAIAASEDLEIPWEKEVASRWETIKLKDDSNFIADMGQALNHPKNG